MSVLSRFSIPDPVIASAGRRAGALRTDLITVLIANGVLGSDAWWRALADGLGVAYRRHLPTALVAPPFHNGRIVGGRVGGALPRVAMIKGDGMAALPLQVLAPTGPSVDHLFDWLRRHPDLAGRIVIAPPGAIELSLQAAARKQAIDEAVNGLSTRAPHLSAKGTPSARQAATVLLAMGLALALMQTWPMLFVIVMCGPASLAFVAISGIRFWAGLLPEPRPMPMLRWGRAPRYLVLVPLFREAGVVADLVRALSRLRYPRERLTIVLIAEAVDGETIAAIKAVRLPSVFRLIVVPDGAPRTKPRALQYALSLFPSDLVTVYDAEDRPHPHQLIEAAQAFATGRSRLACLQSPLVIDTVGVDSTWISRQFAVEYDGLFRRVLPVLANLGIPIPLGGTSMHIKRAALDEIGGWDPYNVTEDADLGMRLARFGYQTGCLALPTYEEAPLSVRAWIRQRSRWLKGWMQTWLVHMRAPQTFWREAGPKGFLALNCFVIGSVIAAVAYPVSVIAMLMGMLGFSSLFADRSFLGDLWLAAFMIAFLCGLSASLWLVAVSAARTGFFRRGDLVLTLAYWALLLPALIRAVRELIVAPYFWQKTTHGLARRPRRFPSSESKPVRSRAPLRPPGSAR